MRKTAWGLSLGLVAIAACSTPSPPSAEPDAASLDAPTSADAPTTDTATDTSCRTDADRDGRISTACGGDDCDDADGLRFPGNAETCDTAGHDEDCDPTTFGNRDGDGDGWLDAACCNQDAAGTRHCGDDCDDARIGVHPDAPETCDGIDGDCDGSVDEGVQSTFYADTDGDGYGDPAAPVSACSLPAAASTLSTDCDDRTAARHPGASEACNAVHDEDCDPSTHPFDADDDGHDAQSCGGDDCDDAAATVHPGATEICNSIDDDCSTGGGTITTEDPDGDMHVAPGSSCTGGFPADDCDPASPTTHPGATELCDDIDQDCDPSTIGMGSDPDGDGYAVLAERCCNPQPDGSSRCVDAVVGDCEPTDAAIHPGATETCNARDDDCDWMIDDGLTGCSASDPSAGRVSTSPCSCGATTPVCCVTGPSTASCIAHAAACAPPSALRLDCDGAEDCSTGQVCCLAAGPTSACGAATSGCTAGCTTHEDCPTGRTCTGRTTIGLRTFTTCQ